MKHRRRPLKACTKSWQSYEQLAHSLLSRYADAFGLSGVLGKHRVHGLRSGTRWEIDAKGSTSSGKSFVVVEVRRYMKKRISQEAMGAIAYRIIDTGAAGGIVVSPLGLQKGAKLIAAREGIRSLVLVPGTQNGEFFARFLRQVVVGMPVESIQVTHALTGGSLTLHQSENEA